jgi:hypothetical protein
VVLPAQGLKVLVHPDLARAARRSISVTLSD